MKNNSSFKKKSELSKKMEESKVVPAALPTSWLSIGKFLYGGSLDQRDQRLGHLTGSSGTWKIPRTIPLWWCFCLSSRGPWNPSTRCWSRSNIFSSKSSIVDELWCFRIIGIISVQDKETENEKDFLEASAYVIMCDYLKTWFSENILAVSII